MSDTKRVVLTGINHKRLAVDLAKADSIEDVGSGEVHLWIGGECLRISGNFDEIVTRWQGE
jgi:hypothetical protein